MSAMLCERLWWEKPGWKLLLFTFLLPPWYQAKWKEQISGFFTLVYMTCISSKPLNWYNTGDHVTLTQLERWHGDRLVWPSTQHLLGLSGRQRACLSRTIATSKWFQRTPHWLNSERLLPMTQHRWPSGRSRAACLGALSVCLSSLPQCPGGEALWSCGRVWNNEEGDWAEDLPLSVLITHRPAHWTPQMGAATRAASAARDSPAGLHTIRQHWGLNALEIWTTLTKR